ncbi:hypothetical protein GCM10010329_54600 [Streptomyces spiroverticillatus]|nr:hypothetical protein [Streptomyces finlayi]GHA24332.1 hypothetical protein GCM10010329_54600 [Streptomyces spiroverticillatus]
MNATTRTEDKSDNEAAEAAEAEAVAAEAAEADETHETPEIPEEEVKARPASAGVGAGAAGIVSAGLGLVALVGGWPSRVLAERETLVSQLNLSKSSAASAQIEGLYGNGWHMTALVNGGFALVALLVGVVVLAALRPTGPDAAPRLWIRAVAWAGVILGLIGLLISTGMYLDLFAPMPVPPAA